MRDAGNGPLIGRSDLDRLLSAAFMAALGVMCALCLTAYLWPAPGPFVGRHPLILDSTISQLRLEPREKGFLALATALGFLAAFFSFALRKPAIRCTAFTTVLLILVIPVFNVCCDRALNEPSGIGWASAGLMAVLVLTAVSRLATRSP